MVREFEPKLGRIGGHKNARAQSFERQVMNIAYKYGLRSGRRSGFTGSRIGKGNAFGTLAGAGLFAGGQRRVIVKVRIAKLKSGDLSAPRAHLHYIQRDGVTPEGEAGHLYGRDTDLADGNDFLEDCNGDRHQFRLIVSAEDATELAELKPFIRDFMAKVEDDLGTRLNWVAVDHFNTGHPHTHIIIQGRDELAKDLIIARDYVSHGFRSRAMELVTLELGPEIESELRLKLAREVDADRFTRLDRALLNRAENGILVISDMPPSDSATHAAHMVRLRKLEHLGLADEQQTGVWQLKPNIETKLKSLGQRGDIIKTMHRAMTEAGIDRPAGSFAIHDAAKDNKKLVGRVAAIGLTDELSDRTYVVIDGLDGKVHYAQLGTMRPEFLPQKSMIVSLESASADNIQNRRPQLLILSYLSFENLTEAHGASWLDKELVKPSRNEPRTEGFGADVKDALARRRQWLVAQSFGRLNDDGTFLPAPNMLAELRQRDIRRATIQLAIELQLDPTFTRQGEQVSGVYRQAVNLASGKYAVLQKAKEFTLVPWRPEFEKLKGQNIAGVIGANDALELIGQRKRGLSV